MKDTRISLSSFETALEIGMNYAFEFESLTGQRRKDVSNGLSLIGGHAEVKSAIRNIGIRVEQLMRVGRLYWDKHLDFYDVTASAANMLLAFLESANETSKLNVDAIAFSSLIQGDILNYDDVNERIYVLLARPDVLIDDDVKKIVLENPEKIKDVWHIDMERANSTEASMRM